jgi:hypothetical protein
MLEKITNMAVLITSIVVLFVVVHDRMRAPGENPHAIEIEAYSGKHITLPSDTASAQMQSVIILGLSAKCGFCIRSMPFYRRLQGMRDASQGRLRIIAYFKERLSESQKEFGKWGFTPNATIVGAPQGVNITSTPTILLADGTGNVNNAWIGLLDTKGEDDVLTKLTHQCMGCFASNNAKDSK